MRVQLLLFIYFAQLTIVSPPLCRMQLKKWVARLVAWFIQRYGNPRYCDTDYKSFALHFRANTAVALLGSVMNTLALRANGKFVTDEVHRSCMTFLVSSVEMSPTYKALKPHMQFILFQVVFPTLGLKPSELEMFRDDPQEFIRKVCQRFYIALISSVSALQHLNACTFPSC